jgi:hypothetical protein
MAMAMGLNMVLANQSTEVQERFIDAQERDTVQYIPDATEFNAPLRLSFSKRGPLLPGIGTRERERALFVLYWHDNNTLFRGGVAAIVKKIQSTPWEIKGPEQKAQYFQNMLANADFGAGWGTFLSKGIIDYSRQDAGAYFEVIGRGAVEGPIVGPVTGISVLDSRRCMPTGDPEHPVIYMDTFGKMHLMHRSRVWRFVDMPDANEVSQYFGDCALGRAVAPVTREILMGRYIEVSLDDRPPPGVVIFGNLTDKKVESALKRMHDELRTDMNGDWGRTVRLYGAATEVTPTVEFVTFSQTPEKFDFEKYKTLNAREIALSLGIDIQDIWELTGNNIGSATQSEILHRKAKGKGVGRILKTLERFMNAIMPPDMEFRFSYQDFEDDQNQATLANQWATAAAQLAPYLSKDQIAQLLANQIEAVRDVVTDQTGVVVRLPDSDPKTPEQLEPAQAEDDTAAPTPEEEVVVGERALVMTQVAFMDAFNRALTLARSGVLDKRAVRAILRTEVVAQGRKAYIDGLRDGDADSLEIDKTGERIIGRWRAQQLQFVNDFVDKLFKDEFTNAQLQQKAQQWVNKSINPLYYAGMEQGNVNQQYMWVVNPAKEHCKTCLKLNGQVHKLKEYIKRGLLPQSPKLECGGWECGCKLVKSQQPARGRFSGLFGRIVGALRPGATGG